MNNGYYLSTYLHINEVAHLTGMRIRHDQNVSLWHKTGIKSILCIIGNWSALRG